MSSEKIIVLYERLSREDENLGESYSISNQKKLLEDYCREKGWTRFRHFTDDGRWRGGNHYLEGHEPIRTRLSCGRSAKRVLP